MRVGLLCALAVSVVVAGPARGQMDSREGIILQNQILELRRDLQTLQAQRGGGYAPVPAPYRAPSGGGDLAAQLLERVATLEDSVRQLRGQVEEQGNAMRRLQEDLSKQVSDLQFQLRSAAGAPPQPAPSRTPPPANLGAGPETPPVPAERPARRTPEMSLQEGNAALARRDYPAAEAAAREVLAAGRNSPRASDANFLLAQALMGQRNFQGAAVAYDDAYQRSRTGSRAPDALIGLAGALTGLNERLAACSTIDKLRAEFPALRRDLRESVAALTARNGCR